MRMVLCIACLSCQFATYYLLKVVRLLLNELKINIFTWDVIIPQAAHVRVSLVI